MKTLGLISFWLAMVLFGVAIYFALGGCMSHEQGLQMHREIAEHEKRISDLEAGRNEPAPPIYQNRNGD